MLSSQNLLSLQERRRHLRLALLFRLVEATVPAICAGNYIMPQPPNRAVRMTVLKDYITSNILDSQVTHNTKYTSSSK